MDDLKLGRIRSYQCKLPALAPMTVFESCFYATIPGDEREPDPAYTTLFTGPFRAASLDTQPPPNTGGSAWLSAVDTGQREYRMGAEHYLFAGVSPAELCAFVRRWGGTIYAPAAEPDPEPAHALVTRNADASNLVTVDSTRVPDMPPFTWRPIALGELIGLLEGVPSTCEVRFAFNDFVPTRLQSYRGYYEQLALGFDTDYQRGCTVANLLTALRSAIGATLDSYKGGGYTIGRDTPVWAANWGEAPSTAIIGLSEEGSTVYLETCHI